MITRPSNYIRVRFRDSTRFRGISQGNATSVYSLYKKPPSRAARGRHPLPRAAAADRSVPKCPQQALWGSKVSEADDPREERSVVLESSTVARTARPRTRQSSRTNLSWTEAILYSMLVHCFGTKIRVVRNHAPLDRHKKALLQLFVVSLSPSSARQPSPLGIICPISAHRYAHSISRRDRYQCDDPHVAVPRFS